MAKKFILTPYWLFVVGEWIGEIKNVLAQSTTYYGQVRGEIAGLSVLKDNENLKFIGKLADSLFSDLYAKYESQKDACLDSEDIEDLKRTIIRWEGRLQEISKNWVLSCPDTHIDATKLAEGPNAFLGDDEFNMLEPLEKQGLGESVSSLLHANFISAEFMALRTAESLLKRWYEKKTGKKLVKTTWGQVLDRLNDEFPKQERPKELLLLDYLRERRNEIAHPGAISGSVAASTTFLNAISLCKSLLLEKS